MLRKKKQKNSGESRAYQQAAEPVESDPAQSGNPFDPRIAAIVEEMEPALRRVYEDLKKRYFSLDRNEVLTRHEMATTVREVRDGGAKYGDGPVKKLAQALLGSERKDKMLYRWAHVADAWPTSEAIGGVIARCDKFGRPLSWSHLEELAEVEDERAREELVDLTIAKSLSVRRLRALIDTERNVSPNKQNQASAAPRTLAATIAALMDKIERMAQNTEHWHEILVQVGDAPTSPDVTKALQNAVDRLGRLRDACSSTIAEIGAVLSRREESQETPTMPVPSAPNGDRNRLCATV